ncbi:endonuclease/exonuclease/phosphatase family protein [Brumimicrobium mesophilum]|uniref:endonuclease/exonuclease/phosphatase family protein n=1 Tax=Brumimicrobium mesophilum TaxID=392717 RepID=UPI000D14413E|nr:endonuclease/exonuclease/phosphatase family protein [Brumimicrobium mesophilum]
MLFRLFKRLVGLATFIVATTLLISYLGSIVPPDKFWYLQLFALAYPALFVAVVILMILNFMMRRKFAFPLIVLVLGFFVHTKYFGIDFKSPDFTGFSDKKIKVMSYNVRLFDFFKFIDPPLSENKQEFIDLFSRESPDILCIQEYGEVRNRTFKFIINPDDIKNAGGYVDYATTKRNGKRVLSLGQAIYSKYPIIHSETLKKDGSEIPCIFADIVKGEDTVRVYTFHLESIRLQEDEYSLFDTEIESSKTISTRVKGLVSKLKYAYPFRAGQAQTIVDHALTSPYPVFITGDLNDPPSSYTYSIMNEYFKDAFNEASFGMARTYAGKVPAGRIDYIFYGEGLAPTSFSTLKENALSDHYPITSEFRIR